LIAKGMESMQALEQIMRDETVKWLLQEQDLSNGIYLSREANPSDSIHLRKGTVKLNVHPKDFSVHMKGIDTVKEWDPEKIYTHFIHRFDENSYIYYVNYDFGIPLVAPRDFVLLEVRDILPDGTLCSCSVSVSDEFADELAHKKHLETGSVRGKVLVSGWVVKPLSGGDTPSCEASFLVQIDCKGLIPKFVVNRLSMMKILQNVKAKVTKSGSTNNLTSELITTSSLQSQ